MINLTIKNPSKVFNNFILEKLYDYSKRIEVWYGGASSGKSEGIYQRVVLKALKKWAKPRKILILRKINASIRDSAWQHVIDVLANFEILEFCKINKTERTIKLPTGAILIFRGLDDPEKIKSIKGISDIVMEEATEFTLEDFTQLNLRLRDRHHKEKQLILMFNPVSKLNWVYKYFFNEDTGQPKDFDDHFFNHSTYRDNQFLDEVTIAQLEKLQERNPNYYKIYAEGRFATLDKLIFSAWEKKHIDREEIKELPTFYGLDFGYTNDPSALMTVKYDEKKEIVYILSEEVKEHYLDKQLAKLIHDVGISKEKIYADSQRAQSIDAIKFDDNYPVPRIESTLKGAGSVLEGVTWLQQRYIYIDPRCFKTIEEFENYTWRKDKKTGEYYNEPVDSFNHTIDAIRYALNKIILRTGKVKLYSDATDFGI